jgi:hypothetical protein
MKFDLHLNVGRVYRTQKPMSVEMNYTGKEIADYVNYYGITHAVCIYDKYENLKELIDNTDAKIYGVQWITDKDQELDTGKEGWYGIKLHSHRGYRDSRKYDWKHPKKKLTQKEWNEKEEKRSFGLDYADKYVKEILKGLPDGSLVYMHSQGWPSIDNRARPEHLFMLATEFFNLKFVMGHAGGYGGMTAALPGDNEIPTVHTPSWEVHKTSIRNYGDAVVQFNASVLYSNLVHNLFLDSSCYTPDKAIALTYSNKWCVGSDFPFGANKPRNSQGNDEGNHFTEEDFKRSYVWNFEKQERVFANAMGIEKVREGYQNAFDYIETPIEKLAIVQRQKTLNIKEQIKIQANQFKENTK